MGRQVLFHAFPEDLAPLFSRKQEREVIVASLRDSDSSELIEIVHPERETRTMVLWNSSSRAEVFRKLVRRVGGAPYYRVPYYRVDDALPVIELVPARMCHWNDAIGLLQGRLYCASGDRTKDFDVWYKSVAQWIRRSFVKNPMPLLGGYVGPEAMRWFQAGGVLLPMFEPPPTDEWKSFVKSQH